MDKKGYEAIETALRDRAAGEEIELGINPEPVDSRNYVYLTIRTDLGSPAFVLNTLGRAGLMNRSDEQGSNLSEGPRLEVIGITDRPPITSITFKDLNGVDH